MSLIAQQTKYESFHGSIQGSEFYHRPMKTWLHDNDNEG